ncbi:hypothetical protein MKW98_026391 [Papaver atlanticum]|uniref:Uncharacterized protein n=1 Tax=Papaver atlanticum TaxID=357466 RepID=A0AAD4SRJ9_9MAGN|nr:hypothetical protein MKW98_026391 [Papaver atlanticum]
MAIVAAPFICLTQFEKPRFSSSSVSLIQRNNRARIVSSSTRRKLVLVLSKLEDDGDQLDQNSLKEEEEEVEKSLGVKAALSMLKFYKREISPIMPNSCRYVPTCSEYSMEAYKKYGVAKGTILTAWRLCRCNPLGGSGFDPPRWFDEKNPLEE